MFTNKWFQENKKAVGFILLVFLLWQLVITGIIWMGEKSVPTTHQYIHIEYPIVRNPPVFWSRGNFDGMHYLDIARKGYGIYQQAFFPLYPGLIKFLTPYFGGGDLMSGLVVSWLAFLAALFFLYKLIQLDFNERITKRTIIYLLLFPTAFFFSAVYNESLFLFLLLGSFYAARQRKWWIAGVLGAFASATKLVGIFLLPALLWEWWEGVKIQKSKFPPKARLAKGGKSQNLLSLIPIFLVPVGLLWYMRFLAINYQDPLMFLHVQPAFGAERVGDKIILLYQVFWRYFKMIATTKFDPLYFTVWLEFLSASFFLGLLVFAYLRKIRLSYLVFAVFAYITPTLTGTFSSMPRYVLVLFPCFLALALIENKIIRYLFWTISFLLLVVSTIFFTRGYWVG